jgi:prephenate dehydrogenase
MNVAILGGGGRMGRWFARYFRQRGDRVTIYDRDVEAANRTAADLELRVTPDLGTALRNIDVALASVPIRETAALLRAARSHLTRKALLTEISSVKRFHFSLLRRLAQEQYRVLSIHPLFGPATTGLAGQSIAVVPVQNQALELRQARDLFPEARCVAVARALHDRTMAYIVLLPYWLNMAFAGTLLNGGAKVLSDLASPRFARQLLLVGEVLEDDPALYLDIARGTPNGPVVVGKLTGLLRRLARGDLGSNRLLYDIRRRFARSELAKGP